MSKILVVDDEMQIRKLIRKYAEFDGHEVFEAENGMQAVTMVRKNEFDAVIMDIMFDMPEGENKEFVVTLDYAKSKIDKAV